MNQQQGATERDARLYDLYIAQIDNAYVCDGCLKVLGDSASRIDVISQGAAVLAVEGLCWLQEADGSRDLCGACFVERRYHERGGGARNAWRAIALVPATVARHPALALFGPAFPAVTRVPQESVRPTFAQWRALCNVDTWDASVEQIEEMVATLEEEDACEDED